MARRALRDGVGSVVTRPGGERGDRLAGTRHHRTVEAMSVFWVLVSTVAGAMFASYGGVVIERGWKGSNEGRSVCVCGEQLRWFENVPVFSWVMLRGRARCCKAAIPGWYVRSEIAWAIGGAVSGWVLGPIGVGLVVVCVLGWAGAVRARRIR
jgi:prepilin signal peptidase PulO-like enzyme (type II secretory pathway)